jgi:hypothetical protein
MDISEKAKEVLSEEKIKEISRMLEDLNDSEES